MRWWLAAIWIGWVASPVQAKYVQGWNVTAGEKGCFMSAPFEGGTTVLVMLPAQGDNATFLFSNRKWKSIVKDRRYTLRIEIDDMGAWTMHATGSVIDGSPGSADDEGALIFQTPTSAEEEAASFVAEFAVGNAVAIARDNGTFVDKLRLTGTRAALLETARCRVRLRSKADPFSGDAPPGKKTDDTLTPI
jgi:hypothetical protein